MAKLTPDEQLLYLFAFRYGLPRQTCALSKVAGLVTKRVDKFDDFYLQRMVSEIEECWRNEREINSIDLDVQTQFRQELIDALAKRSAKGE
jgi:hypothetical protein